MAYEDTYFFSSQEALLVASQKNKQDKYNLQICYYNGEKIKSDLVNLVHAPIENLVENLALGIYRLPTSLNFSGLDISNELREMIIENFKLSLEQAREARNKLNVYYLEFLREVKLDFSEPLRFYMQASAYTQVMQHILKNIAEVLKDMGYDVMFHLNYGVEDKACLKLLKEFNPHVLININHINNTVIGKDVFNFIWFQDSMPIVTNSEPLNLRKRDFLFALLPGIQKLLEKKAKHCEIQNFCINTKIYKQRKNIRRKKKIVFIGGSYLENYMPYNSASNQSDISELLSDNTQKLFKEIQEFYYSDGIFDLKVRDVLSRQYNVSIHAINAYFIPLLIRDYTVIALCNQASKIDYEIEIYGWGWEKYQELKPYYKGVLNYGEEISEVYNSATYAIVAHPDYIIQQRTLEAAASGCIPLVYDCRYSENVELPYYEESLVYFQNLKELNSILTAEPYVKNLRLVVNDHSYEEFIRKLLAIIAEKESSIF